MLRLRRDSGYEQAEAELCRVEVGEVAVALGNARRRLIGELADANAGLRTASAANSRLREQLVEQARQAGVQQERQRMAREIHDTLAQDMSAVVAQLEVALAAAGHGDQWTRPVSVARDVARDGLAEVRHSIQALASPLLDGAALPGALDVLATLARHRPHPDEPMKSCLTRAQNTRVARRRGALAWPSAPAGILLGRP
jgi:signal transduction histidine kinase